jgi:hypothetical protein
LSSAAQSTLKQMNEKEKGVFGFLNPFRSKKLEEELKGYQEKLKTMTPILALAVQTRKRQSTSSKSPKAFNVGKIIKSHKAKQFWVQHFGQARTQLCFSLHFFFFFLFSCFVVSQWCMSFDSNSSVQEYKVEWKRFSAAFQHEFESQLKELGLVYKEHASTLRMAIDKNNGTLSCCFSLSFFFFFSIFFWFKRFSHQKPKKSEGEVDVYSFNALVQNDGIFEKFLTLIPKVPSPMMPKKRKSQAGDELQRETKRGKE